MYTYIWSDNIGKEDVKKVNDDVLDAVRYALFSNSRHSNSSIGIKPKGF